MIQLLNKLFRNLSRKETKSKQYLNQIYMTVHNISWITDYITCVIVCVNSPLTLGQRKIFKNKPKKYLQIQSGDR